MKRKPYRRLLAAAALAALVLAAVLYQRWNDPTGYFAVLEYHDFTEDAAKTTDYTMTVAALRRDLDFLRAEGYVTVLPRELAAGQCDDGSALPEKMVLLTFDDGYASNYTLAFPVLKEYGAKATVSLITERIDSGKDGFLSWEQCREMARSGLVEFASHTHDLHIRDEVLGIDRMEGETREAYEARVFPDLEESIARIREELDSAPTAFTYPLGNMDEWAEPFLRERFAVTFSGVYGRAERGGELYRLPRCNVSDRHAAREYVRRGPAIFG